jgi:hypothetical protein
MKIILITFNQFGLIDYLYLFTKVHKLSDVKNTKHMTHSFDQNSLPWFKNKINKDRIKWF